MSLNLFELVGTDAARPSSPYCWRTRMALAHKGLGAESIPWCFTEKHAIAPHQSEKVPVLIDGETSVNDSWTIANYLEDTYADRPSLFGGEGGRALSRFHASWADAVVNGGLFSLVVRDIIDHVAEQDRDYFRTSREERLGRTLEAVVADREARLPAFRDTLTPLRLTLRTQ